MTLLELATFICGKVNQSEPEDVTACKGFLQRRHDLVWQEALWKDSLVEYRQALDPDLADYVVTSNYLPSKGVLLLPPLIQRVIASRTTARKLNIQRPEFFYRMDYDAFAKTGEAADYVLLPPCVWEFNTELEIFAQRGNASDAAASLTADLLDTDGVGVTRSATVLAEVLNSLGTTERIDAIQKPTTTGAVRIGAATVRIQNISASIAYIYFTPAFVSDVSGLTPAAILAAGETSDIVTPDAWVIFSSDGAGAPENSSEVPNGAEFNGTVISDAFNPFTFGTSTLAGIVLTAAQTNAPRRQRIRLVEIPTAETTIRVLGKRSAPQFTADSDEPGICGMENCLIAFGLADMLERDESYGEAQAKFQEAVQLVEQLKRIETVQQAHCQRITPEGGYGDDSFCGGNSWMQ